MYASESIISLTTSYVQFKKRTLHPFPAEVLPVAHGYGRILGVGIAQLLHVLADGGVPDKTDQLVGDVEGQADGAEDEADHEE